MTTRPEAVVLATASLVLMAGGLMAAAGLASFAHWQGEASQQVATAAQARAAQAYRTAGNPNIEQVLFMPAVAGAR